MSPLLFAAAASAIDTTTFGFAAPLLFAAVTSAIDTTTIGATIEFPVVDATKAVTLNLAEGDYSGPGVVQKTRMYNGEQVGPTIKVSPGDTLNINVVNNLPTPGFDTSALHNQFKTFDITNLHTHGLHISSNAPGDDIFTEVAAGTTNTYTYQLPANHMGGTFWYHPHHHGSTAVHAGGGAAGMIIVDDAPGALPSEIADLDEMHLVMLHLNMPELTAVALEYETNCQNAGGTAALIGAAQRHFDSIEVQGAVAGALRNLSELEECALDIATSDGLEMIVDAFARHSDEAVELDPTTPGGPPVPPDPPGRHSRSGSMDAIYLRGFSMKKLNRTTPEPEPTPVPDHRIEWRMRGNCVVTVQRLR